MLVVRVKPGKAKKFAMDRRNKSDSFLVSAVCAAATAVSVMVLGLAIADAVPAFSSAALAADRAIRRDSLQFEKNLRQRMLLDHLKKSGAIKPPSGTEETQRADATLIYRNLVDERGFSSADAVAVLKEAGYPTDHLGATGRQ